VRTVRTIAELHETARAGVVGLVPTMGALHAGHASLFEAARGECDTVVASIFVNRAQFLPTEDFARYPRDEEQDARVAEEHGVDVLFVPEHDELYPRGYQTWVEVEELGSVLEGAHRPGHFRGVATVCLKLLNIVRPRHAYFGQKDAQQAAVLRRMIRDLNVDVDLRVLPTVRDDDGLALSSRNVYLSRDEREIALTLPRALQTRDRDRARQALTAAGIDTDYVDVLEDDETRVLAAAVRVGATRLIDNVPLEGELT
jgi:pantoate--beta-alanine ligase